MDKEVLSALKIVASNINQNHTDLMCSSKVPEIEVVYYHGEIDDLAEQPLDFINLHNIKAMAEYLLENYTEEEYQNKMRKQV